MSLFLLNLIIILTLLNYFNIFFLSYTKLTFTRRANAFGIYFRNNFSKIIVAKESNNYM